MRVSATYIREGDNIFAFHGNTLIAHGPNFAAVEQSAVEYLDSLVKKDKEEQEHTAFKNARFVETPNGLKGEILGNVDGAWGHKEVTVRWENGRISRYETDGKPVEGYKYTIEAAGEPESALDYLTKTLDNDYGHDKASLVARVKELDGVRAKVSAVVQAGELPAAEERQLSDIAVAAEYEQAEIREALAHLEQADYEAFTPPAPFRTSAVEQASLGGGSGSWLQETVEDMVREAGETNYDKLLIDGPAQFVADVETSALADQGVTASLANSFIEAKTAGLVGDEAVEYRKKFVAKAELARREELKDRLNTQKEAAAKQAQAEEEIDENGGDEALFL